MAKIAKELGALAVSRLKEIGDYPVGRVAGLYLQVRSAQARSWILRVKVGDKRREIGLGAYPGVGLKDAQIKAQAVRDKVAAGIDPVLERRELESKLRVAQASEITFADAAKKFIAAKSHEWKNAKHGDQWKNTLEEYAYPVIGNMFVRHITREHVLQVLEPIWVSKTETASRVRGRIENVLDWARVKGFRSGENPALWRGNLDHLLSKPTAVAKVRHQPALPFRKIGSFIEQLRAVQTVTARCLEFAILTAARSKEVRTATWTSIDLDEGIWTVRSEDMKKKKEHRVPLSSAAITLLKGLSRDNELDLVFPSPTGKVLSDMTLLAIIKRMNGDTKPPPWFDPKQNASIVPHGFRSTFRDWAGELSVHPRELIEVALAHVKGDQTEAAYWRGDVIDRRRALMEDWAQFVDRPYSSATVIPLQRQA